MIANRSNRTRTPYVVPRSPAHLHAQVAQRMSEERLDSHAEFPTNTESSQQLPRRLAQRDDAAAR
ncbi:hypothetical protein [Streptomyces sp. NPDC052127]|uniref:hypothetical protein n=1 Tax=Streptomyces sp. NPDC052127 TaxID=3155679 RepID=UPI0034417568